MISCDLEGVSIFCILFFLSSFYLSYSYHPSTANTRSRFSMSWAVMDGGRERARGEKRRNKEKKAKQIIKPGKIKKFYFSIWFSYFAFFPPFGLLPTSNPGSSRLDIFSISCGREEPRLDPEDKKAGPLR